MIYENNRNRPGVLYRGEGGSCPQAPVGLFRYFEQTWIPFTQGCFVPSLVEIGQVVLEKKMKKWKVYDNDNNNDNNNDDDGQRTIFFQKSLNLDRDRNTNNMYVNIG